MSYHKYQTEAFVLAHKEYGESGRIFFLLTKEFGLVVAVAHGIRKPLSKLRYALQTYAYIRAELIRGKEIWRLVGAERYPDYEAVMTSSRKQMLYARMGDLVLRYVIGEHEHRVLFDEMQAALLLLSDPALLDDDIEYVEQLWNLRMFKELGYISDEAIFDPMWRSECWSTSTLRLLKPLRKEVIRHINNALTAAQL
jgi:DNA repair protein RecO (recombination protein O)